VFFILCFQPFNVQGQRWEFQSGIAFQPSFSNELMNSWNGLFVNTSYFVDFNDKQKLFARLAFESNAWANHVIPGAGFYWRFLERDKWNMHFDFSAAFGVALFRPKLLFSGKNQTTLFFNYPTRKNHEWGLGLGIQHIYTPQYKKYSSVFQSLSFPIVLRWKI
jgi:hypothetical protein